MIQLQKLELVFGRTEEEDRQTDGGGRTDGRGSRNSYLDLRVLWTAKNTIKSHATPWRSNYKQIWYRSLKWGTLSLYSSNSCKTVQASSWLSKKIETFWVRGYVLCSSARENTRENQKSKSGWNLGTHSSGAPEPNLMVSTSFESSKLYLLG